MLFFTGFSRLSSEIQMETKSQLKDKTKQLLEMKTLVDEAEKVLVNKDRPIDEFGKLLDYSWSLKKQTGSKISTDYIDVLYDKAKNAGALGGKLLGAGGGGFLLFYVPEERQEIIKEKLSDLLYVPFLFENDGTDIIYYSPEEYPPIY